MSNPNFSILITTKNRKNDLTFTLEKIKHLIDRNDVECMICDDGSTDDTANYIQTQYPEINFIQNSKSKGLIYSRNRMMAMVKSEFAISIDDDLHFITQNPLEIISEFFRDKSSAAVLSFRIFWGKAEPISILSNDKPMLVQSYAGGANVFRMKAWREIPNYPEWFVFYGEENFASYQLFKKHWEIYYLPEVLVHHRVNLKARSIANKDFGIRYRRSIRAGWYGYFLFYPLVKIPRAMAYSLWMQFKNKILKGNFKVLFPVCQALFDLIINMPKCIINRNALTTLEYEKYQKLNPKYIYWKPEI